MARLNVLAAITFGRLAAAKGMIDLFDSSIPDMEMRDSEELTERAGRQEWDESAHEAEIRGLDEKFNWLRRFSAYSHLILLYSIVETQLRAVATKAGADRQSKLRLEDERGKGIDQAKLYLKRVAEIKVSVLPNWERIKDLQQLRNMLVHAGGWPSNDEHREHIKKLSRTYPRLIKMHRDWWPLVWISTRLCSQLTDNAEVFFRCLFRAAGLSDRSFEPSAKP